MMQVEEQMEANKSYREREAAAAIARKAREALSVVAGIRLQDAIVGRLYHVTALYSGDTGIYEYTGCHGSHDHVAHGVHVGAIGYFLHPVYGYHTAHGGESLEPGGRSAQWFMVPLTTEEEAAAPAQFEKERAAEKIRRVEEDKAYAAYVAALPPYLR